MIISKTPYRISFFGGGSDYPNWYNNYSGSVLSTTIDKQRYNSSIFLTRIMESILCQHLVDLGLHIGNLMQED